jgi:hypothetical protein
MKKNLAHEVIYEINFDDEWKDKKIIDLRASLYDMFEDVLKRASKGLAGNDFGRVFIKQQNLYSPIVIPPTPFNN